ncbi:MAG TPA: hypothetical protein VGF18_00635 [Candidatus Tumulicola sp.]|jgi:hypothetical protein
MTISTSVIELNASPQATAANIVARSIFRHMAFRATAEIDIGTSMTAQHA